MQSSSAQRLTPAAENSSGAVIAPDQEQPTVISNRVPLPTPSADTVSPPGIGTGARLGPFELLECVGGGGMGRVFRARDTALNRVVAVKVLSREQARDPETLLRFRNEAQSAARLNHENIVQVHYVGEEQGMPFIVFEFLEGPNVRLLVEQRGSLPLGEAVSYVFQVAEALTHAWEKGVVHRDIKPSNMLITPGGRVKLIDMGLARVQRDDAAGDLTASGVTLGTFDYISPEQARDPRTADVRSDIYSLGCTLFYMLAGRPPFPEGTVLQKLLQHQGEEPPDVRQFRPELPEEVSRLVRRMMAKDPRRRFQKPAELTAALLRLSEQVGLQPLGPGETLWASRHETRFAQFQRHLPWMAPVSLLLAVVVLLDVLWSTPLGDAVALAPQAMSRNESPAPAPAPSSVSLDEGLWEADPPEAPPKQTPGVDAPPRAVEKADPVAAGPAVAKPPTTASAEAPGPTAKPPASPAGAAAAAPTAPANSGGEPAGAAASAPSKAAGMGVLVVDGVGGENRFASLAAACSKAVGGDAIELRFNGPRRETPLALNNLKVTIRAGEGYRPVLVFRPSDPDPIRCPRAMLALASSQATLVNVALVLELPRDALADAWSLFELSGCESLRLEQCSLTVRNASDEQRAFHPDVAFFRLREPAAPPALAEPAGPPSRTRLTLADCVARGEAVLLRVQDPRPLDFAWSNGLAVTTERLLAVDGLERAPAPEDGVRLDLQHLTAVVRDGLCLAAPSDSASYLAPLNVKCGNCIFVGAAGAPLVEQRVLAAKETHESRLAWSGERNFYESFGVFLSVGQAGDESAAPPKGFDEWRAHWGPEREILPSLNRVQWKRLPAADVPVHEHLAADYALSNPADGGTANPAVGGASDGKDAGMSPAALPPLPPAERILEAGAPRP